MARARAAKKKRARTSAPATAAELATKQRDISVSEFFAKNRHLLGFDNPFQGAADDCQRRRVDNALDACEEAGILPDIRVEITAALAETRFSIAIQDNGPGIVRAQVPKIFGQVAVRIQVSSSCDRAAGSRASESAPPGCTGC